MFDSTSTINLFTHPQRHYREQVRAAQPSFASALAGMAKVLRAITLLARLASSRSTTVRSTPPSSQQITTHMHSARLVREAAIASLQGSDLATLRKAGISIYIP